MNTIETLVLDSEGFELYSNDMHETVKQAKTWVKDCLLEQSWWDRLAENKTFALDVYTIQLKVNGEIRDDWFPEFK